MSESPLPIANPNVISDMATVENGEALPAIRDDKGQFVPGVSGNPDGRPIIKHITDALKEKLAAVDPSDTSGAERLAKQMMGMAEQDRDYWLSLAAIKEITDRTEGKAVQNTNVRGVIVMMPADAVLDASFNAAEPGDE